MKVCKISGMVAMTSQLFIIGASGELGRERLVELLPQPKKNNGKNGCFFLSGKFVGVKRAPVEFGILEGGVDV